MKKLRMLEKLEDWYASGNHVTEYMLGLEREGKLKAAKRKDICEAMGISHTKYLKTIWDDFCWFRRWIATSDSCYDIARACMREGRSQSECKAQMKRLLEKGI